MSPLIFNNRTANSFMEKADVLKKAFFPASLAANLSNLEGYIYLSAKDCPLTITKQEVLAAIHQLKADIVYCKMVGATSEGAQQRIKFWCRRHQNAHCLYHVHASKTYI